LILPTSSFAQAVEWDVSLWGKRRAFTEHIEKLSELVEEKTSGEFKINISYGGLAKPKQNLEGIAAGDFEMAQFCAGYHPEKNPAVTVLELPYLGVSSLEEERRVSQYLYRHEAVLAGFAKWGALPLLPSPLPQYNLIGVGDVPGSLKDLSGLSVRATGGIGKAMELLDAVPESLTATEVQGALESGVINAVAFAPHAHMSYRSVAIGEWWTTNLSPGTVHCPVVANIDAVNRLSAAHQEALYGSVNEALDYYIEYYEFNMRQAWHPALDALGIERVTFSDEEIAAFREEVEAPTAMEWIEEKEGLGLPAVEIYRLVKIALSGLDPEEVLRAEREEEERIRNEAMVIAQAEAAEEQRIAEESAAEERRIAKAEIAKRNVELLELERLASVLDKFSFDKRVVERIGTEQGPIDSLVPGSFSFDSKPDDDLPIASTEVADNAALVTDVPAVNVDESVVLASASSTAGSIYFGRPGKGKYPVSSDPLKNYVGWEYNDDTTVGEAMTRLADHMGYALVSNNEIAEAVYSRKLPFVHRSVEAITLDDGFQLLSGDMLMTLFDHRERSVSHVPMRIDSNGGVIPLCPAEVRLASILGEL